MEKYLKNINNLIYLEKKQKYNKTKKIAIGNLENREIYITEFLFAKQRGWIKDFVGHTDISNNYLRLIPFIFEYKIFNEVLINIKDNRKIYCINLENYRIFHIIDENNFLISYFEIGKKNFYKQLDKRFKIIKSGWEGGHFSILSPARPFWRHPDFIWQLYQKFLDKSIKTRKTILITRHDKIGDFVTTLPMAKVLREQTTDKIIYLVSKINKPLAKYIPFIDEVIIWEDDVFKMAKKIKKYNIDTSISAYIENKLGIALIIAGVKDRIAPKTKIAQIFFNNKIRQKRSEVKKTEWEYNLDLLKVYNKDLKLNYTPPILEEVKKEKFIIFHPGFGGSSDGNLSLEDYWYLAQKAIKYIKVVFTFGPDDKEAKEFFRNKITNNFKIRDDFANILEFTKFIAKSSLFISTSTGPMHLAGLTNTKTLSFFGDNLFASYKRWATISNIENQNNFIIPKNYDKNILEKIEKKMIENIIKIT